MPTPHARIPSEATGVSVCLGSREMVWCARIRMSVKLDRIVAMSTQYVRIWLGRFPAHVDRGTLEVVETARVSRGR